MGTILHQPFGAESSSLPSVPGNGTRRKTIAYGDLVILYMDFKTVSFTRVEAGKVLQNKFGIFKHQDWVGKPFGSSVRGMKEGMGYIYLLAPTPELWTRVLLHRTQILYAADISLICSQLELRPGCLVLESGTGSGSLTHSLARAVAPSGRVRTFEFHEQRCSQAAAEVAANGLAHVVHVEQRNIQALGFPEELYGKADAVFLDLPGPWEVVESASKCLRPDGVICAFTPCIEQVQRTAAALAAHGFWGTRMLECLLREYDVRTQELQTDPLAEREDPRKRGRQTAGNNKRKREDAADAQGPSPATNGVEGMSKHPGPLMTSHADPSRAANGVEGMSKHPGPLMTSHADPSPAANGVEGPSNQHGPSLVDPSPGVAGECPNGKAGPGPSASQSIPAASTLRPVLPGCSPSPAAASASVPVLPGSSAPPAAAFTASPAANSTPMPVLPGPATDIPGRVASLGAALPGVGHVPSGGTAGGARVVTRPAMLARGHTGYLTFGRKMVPLAADEADIPGV